MLTGPQLGDAIRDAMKRKQVTQQQVADFFGVKQSSVSEWLKFGRIHKKHLLRLVDYFSSVVGPEHWGLPRGWSHADPDADLLPLRDRERDLLPAFRLLDDREKDEILAHVRQIVVAKHGPIADVLERLGVSTRADDAAVAAALGSVPKPARQRGKVIHDVPSTPAKPTVPKVRR